MSVREFIGVNIWLYICEGLRLTKKMNLWYFILFLCRCTNIITRKYQDLHGASLDKKTFFLERAVWGEGVALAPS